MKSVVRAEPQRILLLCHEHLAPTGRLADYSSTEQAYRKTEFHVRDALLAAGHDVRVVPLATDLGVISKEAAQFHPSAVFNMVEAFRDFRSFDQHVVSYLECLGLAYTGCNPRGMTIARDKLLTKQVLSYHRIPVPACKLFPIDAPVRPPVRLPYPLLVKSASDDGSTGISMASVVQTRDELVQRVRFIHQSVGTDALAEQFVEGREIYVGVLGDRRLQTLPAWELHLDGLPKGMPRIATERLKRSPDYQTRYNVRSGPANLPANLAGQLSRVSKRVYRLLGLSGYARLDFRMTPSGQVYLIEANPNPQIASDEDFAASAAHAGMTYHELLGKIVKLAQKYRPHGIA
jgi:D-alanine-D-alanine ligase